MTMKTLLIHNVRSGNRDQAREVKAAADRLSSAGWSVETVASDDVDVLSDAVRHAVATGIEAVVVAGGDGTLNLAVQALAHRDTVLGVLPCGTANAWAREFGIPMNLDKATDVLLNGETVRVDLGMANERYFLFIASIGFDAMVVRGMDSRSKRRLGKAAYIIAGLTKSLEMRGEEVTISSGGRTLKHRVLMVAVSNLRQYGGVAEIAPGAFADDGLLDVTIFRGQGLLAALGHAIRVLLRLHDRNTEADTFTTTEIQVEAKNELPVELDGDYFGSTPVNIRVAPGALRTIVPAGTRAPLGSGTRHQKAGRAAASE
jgi:diacylglycerol kinase (ATP)